MRGGSGHPGCFSPRHATIDQRTTSSNFLGLEKTNVNTHFNANRYLGPSFSNSANTQSVTVGIHLASKQSIIPCTSSILFWIEKLMKLVSMRTRYGGPRAVLCDKKREAGRGVL